MPNLIRRVAIVGGTHGNELTGVYLAKKFQQFPELLHRPSLDCMTLLANPQATLANRRYIDRDLNRCFDNLDLANPDLTSYEDQLAKTIVAQLGPKDAPQADIIIDLHSTTANMGFAIMPSTKHPLNLRLAAYLTTLHPEVRILFGLQCDQEAPMLRSLSPLGCTLEVGPIAQGVVLAEKLQQTEFLIQGILDYLEAINQGQPLAVPETVAVYEAIATVDYPRDAAGDLRAVIHPQLQFRDYEALHPGDPIFLGFLGEKFVYEGETVIYPVFINEAAYYEKNMAMVLTQKWEIQTKDETSTLLL
jgi:succinylglutamate desuccinylase